MMTVPAEMLSYFGDSSGDESVDGNRSGTPGPNTPSNVDATLQGGVDASRPAAAADSAASPKKNPRIKELQAATGGSARSLASSGSSKSLRTPSYRSLNEVWGSKKLRVKPRSSTSDLSDTGSAFGGDRKDEEVLPTVRSFRSQGPDAGGAVDGGVVKDTDVDGEDAGTMSLVACTEREDDAVFRMVSVSHSTVCETLSLTSAMPSLQRWVRLLADPDRRVTAGDEQYVAAAATAALRCMCCTLLLTAVAVCAPCCV